MANNCIDCEFCLLVDQDCVYQYSPLREVAIKDIAAAVLAANAAINSLTGNCDLCNDEEGTYDAFQETVVFKQYYSNLIYKFWLKLYGSGRSSAEGLITKSSDQFSDFQVKSDRSVDSAINKIDEVLELFEQGVIDKFKELHASCFECEDQDKCACGKNTSCQCSSQSNCCEADELDEYDVI